MAATEFGTSSPQNVLRWSKMLWRETIFKMWWSKFLGSDPNSIITRITDLESNAGDTVKYDLLLQMTQYGVTGDNPIRGYEEGLEYRQDSVKIDQRRIAHVFRRMSSQRTLHDIRMDAKGNLSDRMGVIFDEMMFAYLAGTAGDNAALAAELPHAGNALVDPSGGVDADHYISHGAIFDTDAIDKAAEKAKTIAPIMRPCRFEGEEVYVMIIHPFSTTDLRITSGASKWREITSVIYSGQPGQNPLLKGALGKWGNVILHESTRIPRTAGVAHSLFLGAQAGCFALGNAYAKPKQTQFGSQNMMIWSEEEADHGNEMSIATGSVYGMKKSVFDYASTGSANKAFGVIRVDVNAAAHT